MTAFRNGEHDLLPLATSGTALTPVHAKVLAHWCRRHAVDPVIAYDGDQPGQRAAIAAAELLRCRGLRPAVAISLPAACDPADYLTVSRDLSPFRPQPSGSAVPLPEAVARRIIDAAHAHWNPAWPETKTRVTRAINAYLQAYPPDELPSAAAIAYNVAATRAGIDADVLIAAAHELTNHASLSGHARAGTTAAPGREPRAHVLRPSAFTAPTLQASTCDPLGM